MCDLTPEQEDTLYGEPPETTAEEADAELRASIVAEFVDASNKLVDAIDELTAAGIVASDALDVLRDAVMQTVYPFDPDFEDHSIEDLS